MRDRRALERIAIPAPRQCTRRLRRWRCALWVGKRSRFWSRRGSIAIQFVHQYLSSKVEHDRRFTSDLTFPVSDEQLQQLGDARSEMHLEPGEVILPRDPTYDFYVVLEGGKSRSLKRSARK